MNFFLCLNRWYVLIWWRLGFLIVKWWFWIIGTLFLNPEFHNRFNCMLKLLFSIWDYDSCFSFWLLMKTAGVRFIFLSFMFMFLGWSLKEFLKFGLIWFDTGDNMRFKTYFNKLFFPLNFGYFFNYMINLRIRHL